MDLANYEPTVAEVAGLFGKSSRWIFELRSKGVMPADGATLGEFVEAWTNYLLARDGGGETGSLEAERTRLTAEQADGQAMKNAQLRGDLLAKHDVVQAGEGFVARCRARLLAIPSRAAPLLLPMKTAVAIEDMLRRLVNEALAELAGIRAVANDLADAGDGGDGERMGGGVVASADLDGKRVGGRA